MLTPGYSVPAVPDGERRRTEYEMAALRDEARRWLGWSVVDRPAALAVEGAAAADGARASGDVLLPVLVVALHVRAGR